MVIYDNFIVKERFEDFLVDENICLKLNDVCDYSIFVLKKQGYTTFEAVDIFSRFLDVDRRLVGYAGLKDEDGITIQRISVPIEFEQKILSRIEEFNEAHVYDDKFIKCYFIGYAADSISVGKLNGNAFRLTLRNMTYENAQKLMDIRKRIMYFPNYYDQQRFGLPDSIKVSHQIGEKILNGDLKDAFDLVKISGEAIDENILPEEFFESIDDRKKSFYCNAFASLQFNMELSNEISAITNECLDYRIIDGMTVCLPLDDYDLINKKIMGQYTNIDRYDASAGTVPRKSKRENVISTSMRFFDISPDSMHDNFYSIVVEFDLPMGCYATMAMKQLDVILNRI